ncbi:hypothetical protein FSHL1_002723 [Fusarium sambucinum]
MATTTTTQSAVPIELCQVSEQPNVRGDATSPDSTGPESKSLGRVVYFKILSACFSFLVAGVNDGSVGALIPYMIRDYDINTAIVSSVYAATFRGWLCSAMINTHLCQLMDMGAIMTVGASCQLLGHALRTFKPPFPLFVVSFLFTALGQALNDTHANTFAAKTNGAHRWLALVHASFMGGCLIGPFVATAIASVGAVSKWYLFYTFPVGLSLVNLALISWAFRDVLTLRHKSVAEVPIDEGSTEVVEGQSRNKDALNLIKSTFKRPSVWLLSIFYFSYVGSQITINGWIVEYLVQVRDGNLAHMGFIPAAFNGGCLLGRLILAEPTYRLGERRMVLLYCLLAVGLELLFWLVPNIAVASVAVCLLGFITGPLFATGISVGTKLFPPEIHATALGYIFVFGQMGGAFFPIITGVVASRAGAQVIQPFVLGILGGVTISWMTIPRQKSQSNTGFHEE